MSGLRLQEKNGGMVGQLSSSVYKERRHIAHVAGCRMKRARIKHGIVEEVLGMLKQNGSGANCKDRYVTSIV